MCQCMHVYLKSKAEVNWFLLYMFFGLSDSFLKGTFFYFFSETQLWVMMRQKKNKRLWNLCACKVLGDYKHFEFVWQSQAFQIFICSFFFFIVFTDVDVGFSVNGNVGSMYIFYDLLQLKYTRESALWCS